MTATPATFVIVQIETTDAASMLIPKLAPTPPDSFGGTLNPRRGLNAVGAYLESVANGSYGDARVTVAIQATTGWTAATATIACVVASPPADGDTCVIGGVTFTFKTSPALSDPLQVAVGADGSASITNLLTAINNNGFLSRFVTGAITGTTTKTLTLTAVSKGTWANFVSVSRTGTALTVAGFSGGTNGTTSPSGTGIAVYSTLGP